MQSIFVATTLALAAVGPLAASAVGTVSNASQADPERVTLTLGTPTNGTLGAITAHDLLILDDEPAATLSFDFATSSASEGAGTSGLTLTLSGARTEESRVSFAQTGSATPGGVDVSTNPVSPLIIPAGATTATLGAVIVQDCWRRSTAASGRSQSTR